MSVDGFIAGSGDDLEWLHRPEYTSSDNLGLDYATFTATVDTLVMGRNTFEKVAGFTPWPYEGWSVVVLTSKQLEVPEHLKGKVRFDQGEPAEIVSWLEAEGKQHLYIDGGVTVQQFLRAGLITEITLTYLPILLGEGIALFGSFGRETSLKHVETTLSSNGVVQSRYVTK